MVNLQIWKKQRRLTHSSRSERGAAAACSCRTTIPNSSSGINQQSNYVSVEMLEMLRMIWQKAKGKRQGRRWRGRRLIRSWSPKCDMYVNCFSWYPTGTTVPTQGFLTSALAFCSGQCFDIDGRKGWKDEGTEDDVCMYCRNTTVSYHIHGQKEGGRMELLSSKHRQDHRPPSPAID